MDELLSVESEFLAFSTDKLLELADRIGKCVEQLTPEQVWTRGADNQNAVGNLLLHLNGNVRQWILHGVGEQPNVRDRDSEFAARDGDPARLTASLRTTVNEAAALIRELPADRFLDRITIQGYDVTRMGAIYHVVEHFAGHAFQIMLLTKMFTGGDLGFYAHLSGASMARASRP